MKSKWFYGASSKAQEIIYSMSINRRCIYQMIDRFRVVELWGITRSDNGPEILMFIQITKQGTRASLIIYEVTEMKAAMPFPVS